MFEAETWSTEAVPVSVPHDAPLAVVAPTLLIVYVVLTPCERLAADTVGGELLTVTVGELAAVELALVDTVKLKLAVGTVALPAVKPTETDAPAATPAEHDEELRVITNPLVLAVAPPLWRQVPETRVGKLLEVPETTVVATIALLSESPMVTVPPDAMADGEMKVTV